MDTKIEKAAYIVPDMNLAHLVEQIAKLNKRCAKLGIPEIKFNAEHDHTLHLYRNPLNNFTFWLAEVDIPAKVCGAVPTGAVREMFEVMVEGQAPKYAGWRFIATLEPLTGADDKVEDINLVMAVPGEKCPVSFMRAEYVGRCDHCKAVRARKQTFVVQHDNGDFRAVGRQCIKDFLGHEDPNKLAAWAEMLIELGSLAAGAEGEEAEVKPKVPLGFAPPKGWMSRSRSKALFGAERATVDRVNFILCPPNWTSYNQKEKQEWEELKAAATPTDADRTEAAGALEWALGLDIEKLMADPAGADNYLANLAALARARVVDRKTCGLGGSIIAAWARARQAAINEQQLATRPASAHVGTLKKREVYRVRCDRVIPHEGDFGCTYITKMAAWNGTAYANDLVWFASGNPEMKEGGFYDVKATPKAHEAYKGRPQTVVSRGVVVKELAE